MPQLSDFLGVRNTIALRTGAAVTLSDVGEIGPDGLLYSAQTTDYAVVPNNGDSVIAQTDIIAGFLNVNGGSPLGRQPIVQGDDGSLYFIVPNATAPTGVKIERWSPAGDLVSSVTIDSTGDQAYKAKMFLLSNGSIAAVWSSAGPAMNFAIVDQSLNVIKALTAIEVNYLNGIGFWDAVPLASGGFSVCYQQNASPELQRLATYSNTGTTVLAPTTVVTWNLGTAGLVFASMVQCVTSGNLFIVCASQFTGGSTNNGLNYLTVSPTTGAVVHALTNLSAVITINQPAEISAYAGFVGISWPDGSNQRMWVFNEAGTQQGTTYAPATTSANPLRSKLINDGTYFYLFWDSSSATKKRLTKIANTGGASASVIDLDTTAYNWNCDAFYERGYLVFVAQRPTGTDSARYATVTTSNFAIATSGTSFGTPPATTNGVAPGIIPGGDFTFIFCTDQANVADTIFLGLKYANSSIVGVLANTVGANTNAIVNVVEGAYQTNSMKGSVSMAFDMTTGANIPGNKGVLFPNGAILKGF